MNDCTADAVPATALKAVNVAPVTLTAAAPGSVTVKLVALVAVVCPTTSTVIGPEVAPLGTVAVISVAEDAVTVAVVPLNLIVGEEPKLVPLIVTLAPTVPELGLKLLIDGPEPTGITSVHEVPNRIAETFMVGAFDPFPCRSANPSIPT